MPKQRNFSGFGVVTRQGRFLWQYSRANEQATREAYEKHNPQLDDHPDGYKIVSINLKLSEWCCFFLDLWKGFLSCLRMSKVWKPRQYDPKLCEEIRKAIEAQPRKTIDERIEQALERGDMHSVRKIEASAQRQFNLIVQTNGEISSSYADIRELYKRYEELSTNEILQHLSINH